MTPIEMTLEIKGADYEKLIEGLKQLAQGLRSYRQFNRRESKLRATVTDEPSFRLKLEAKNQPSETKPKPIRRKVSPTGPREYREQEIPTVTAVLKKLKESENESN